MRPAPSRRTGSYTSASTSASTSTAPRAQPGVKSGSLDTDLQLTLGTALEGTALGQPVVLHGSAAATHKFLLGLTGSGKTSFQDVACVQAINQNVGTLYLDPHGDGCRSVVRMLAETGFYADARAYQRVVYLPFAGRGERYVPLNVLAQPAYDPHQVARLVLEAWTRAWPSLAGGAAPVVEQMVLAGCYVLIRHGLPLTALGRVLADSAFRQRLLARVDDEEVLAFFHRFDAAGRRGGLLSESTLRRTFLMLFSPVMRFSLGSLHNVLDLPRLIAQNVTVLCDLSRLDDESKRFLGCLIMVQLEAATLARAALPLQQRHPYQAIIDEAPVFMSQSAVAFEHLLTQARKFGVSLTLAAQVWAQTKKLQAILPNCTLIAFRLSHDDAEALTSWLFTPDPYRIKHQIADPYRAATSHPIFMSLAEQRAEFEQQLQQLPPREALVRVGEQQTTRIRTVKVPESRIGDDVLDAILDRYAQHVLTPRAEIEAQLRAHTALLATSTQGEDQQALGTTIRTTTTTASSVTRNAAVPPPPSALPPRRRRIAPLSDDILPDDRDDV